jgi:arylsulfatase A-like enzyme/Flp pilus assembly protein TadD
MAEGGVRRFSVPNESRLFSGPGSRLCAALIACGFLTLFCAQPEQRRANSSAPPQNLLLITVDTVRADHIGVYGNAAAETPVLDQLAKEGVRFDSAMSAVPLTLPSHATILSGLNPPHHGLRNNAAGRFPTDRETLATLLSAAGRATGAFVGSFVLDHRFGLARGFDAYDDEIERDPAATDSGNLEAERPASAVVDRALDWLEKSANPKSGRPFFAWVHLYDAHAPYTPPEPFRTRHARSLYDGEIAFVDSQIGRLLEFLNRRGLSRSTLVAVAADHGEGLGDHGESTHGVLLYEPTLRVPLILRAPGTLPAGTVIATPVSLADLAPTLLGLLKVRSPGLPASADGRDLSASLGQGVEPAQTDLYAETEYPRIFGWSGLYALRRGKLKYVAAPTAELYDLSRDPGEATSLLSDHTRRPDLDVRLARLQENARRPEEAPVGSEESVAKLASLGYIGGSPSTAQAAGKPLKNPKDMIGLFHRFELAHWALLEGKTDEAARMLESLVANDPENPVFRSQLGKTYRLTGDFPRAIASYRKALAANPQDPEARYNLAVSLQEAGHGAEAFAALTEAIQQDPSRPEAHNALGIALAQTGKLSEALAEFDKAAELDPHDARAQNNRGNILRQQQRFDEAEHAYRRAVELAPRYAEAWNGLGTLEVMRGQPADAISSFERALELAPQDHEARLNIGIAYETMGNRPAALAAYQEFIREAGQDPGFASQRVVARQLIARLSGAHQAPSEPEGR